MRSPFFASVFEFYYILEALFFEDDLVCFTHVLYDVFRRILQIIIISTSPFFYYEIFIFSGQCTSFDKYSLTTIVVSTFDVSERMIADHVES